MIRQIETDRRAKVCVASTVATAETAPRILGAPELPPETVPRPLDEQTLVSVVIPCFNEQDVLPLLFERVRASAEEWGTRYEVILVDDGSTDATWELVRQCHAVDHRWRGLRLARNFGHQAALWAGLKSAQGDAIIVLDADLQDPPEILDAFLQKWSAGFDVVYAVRTRRKEAWPKRLAYHVYYRLLAAVAETPIPLDAGDFGLIDRQVFTAMASTQEADPFVRGLRAWVGFRQIGLAYERDGRAAGSVKYTLPKLLQLARQGVISSSTRPLRLATWLGLAASVMGLLLTILSLAGLLTGVGTWSLALVAVILFSTGVQLLCLGVLGEYLGRLYQISQGRPVATVRGTVGTETLLE